MRNAAIVALTLLLACEVSAWAGRTGQAKSAEVLAKRRASTPHGPNGWARASVTSRRSEQKAVRKALRAAKPGSHFGTLGGNEALTEIRDIVGKSLGLTPGQLASTDRRHDRAVVKQLRRMLREVRTARSQGRPYRDAFPRSVARSYDELERSLKGDIGAIRQRQESNRRTVH
jgi:hypothetical protein